ncbi:hypothetical protein AgCh_031604 [Apium graveolens]
MALSSQVLPKNTNHSAYTSQHTNHSASTSQVLAVVTLLPVSGTLLFLAGITLIGTLIGLTALTIGLAVTGFLGFRAFGMMGLSLLSPQPTFQVQIPPGNPILGLLFHGFSCLIPQGNFISTTKYNLLTFLPKGLYEQKRLQNDKSINNSAIDLLQVRKWASVPWKNLQVGDIVRPGKGNQLLAGIILVSCFVTFAEAREIATNKETFKSCWLLFLFIILMAVGGSGNGSALSRVTSNRGRGGRGRNDTRGLGQGRGNGEVDHEKENDAQGSDEEQEDDDAGHSDGVLTFGRAQRSICDGDYKKKPQLGQPKLGVVTFINGKNIKEARYKKTIRAIVRNNWEFETAKEKGRAREAFLNKCIQEFKPEYKVDKIKELEGDAVVRNHLKANLKCYMNAWKTDADNMVKEANARGDTSATRRTCPPTTYQNLHGRVYVTTGRLRHSPSCRKMEGKMSRSQILSTPVERSLLTNELEKKLEKPPTLLEKFDVSYKKKEKVEEIRRKLKEVVEREEGNSQDAPLCVANQRKRDVELLLEVCPPKKGKVKMFPRHTLTKLVGIDEVSKYTTSQSSLVCIPKRIPKSAYSIIGKVLTDVTNMVEAIEEIEVTRAKLDEQVQKLAARAYPNRENLSSKILWEEYIQIASHMTSPLCQRYKKIIVKDTRSDHMEVDEDDNDVHIDDLEYRFPL